MQHTYMVVMYSNFKKLARLVAEASRDAIGRPTPSLTATNWMLYMFFGSQAVVEAALRLEGVIGLHDACGLLECFSTAAQKRFPSQRARARSCPRSEAD
jgi:hypothetical protein